MLGDQTSNAVPDHDRRLVQFVVGRERVGDVVEQRDTGQHPHVNRIVARVNRCVDAVAG